VRRGGVPAGTVERGFERHGLVEPGLVGGPSGEECGLQQQHLPASNGFGSVGPSTPCRTGAAANCDLDEEQRAKARSEGGSLAPVPYRLVLCGDEVLDRQAQSTVLASLKANSLPPRLTDPTA
jgi:hypothetical protein